MMTAHPPGSCVVCDKATSRRCSRCKSAQYCSAPCQQADWCKHKLLCATFSEFDDSSRPTDEHVKAILFSENDRKPKVVWLYCPWSFIGRYQIPDKEPFLGPSAASTWIDYSVALKRNLEDFIYLGYSDTAVRDGANSNGSIASIAATKPGYHYDWRGPVIAWGTLGQDLESSACRDLDMNDFRHITDFLLWYHYKPLPKSAKPIAEKIMGVRINCAGDQETLNRPCFERVEITATDLVFTKHETSDIADRIGLPIFTRRYPSDSRWSEGRDHGPRFNNQFATLLHLSCDPKAECEPPSMGWGWAPEQWQYGVGSVLVVRQDKKPLLPFDVEALCMYCRDEVLPLFSHSNGIHYPEEPMSKEAVLAMICRRSFYIKWDKLLGENIKAGKNPELTSPYRE